MKMNYAVGFAFTKDKTKLLLIEKTKPLWQAGLLNGIGGKIEEYDKTPCHAMTREFEEESSLKTSEGDWKNFGKVETSSFNLHCFVGFFEQAFLETYQNVTEENIFLVDVQDLHNNQFKGCISNLNWLISTCLDVNIDKIFIDCKYSD